MKKRIIALILAVVTCLLTFVSCGEYNYSKANLEKCTEIADFNALKNALLALSIDDGDFSADEEERKKNTQDMIYRSLAQSITDFKYVEQRKTGKYDNQDLIYYAYFATAVVGEGEGNSKLRVFDFKFDYNDKGATSESGSTLKTADTSMLVAEANGYKYLPYVQAGLNDNEENPLDKAILEAMKDKDIADGIYSADTDTSSKVKAGDFVLVSFTYTHTDTAGNKKEITVSRLPMKVPAADATDYTVPEEVTNKGLGEFAEFAKKLVNVSVNTEQSSATYKTADSTDGTAIDKYEYSKVKVNAVISGEALTLAGIEKYSPTYLEKQNKDKAESAQLTGKFKDVFGDEYDLKGAKLTYYVYPAYIVDVEYSVESILNDFFGAAITTDALDIFASEEYKFEGKDSSGNDVVHTLKALIEKLAKEQKTFDTKEEAYGKAKQTHENLLKDKEKADAELAKEEANLKEKEDDVTAKQAAFDALKKGDEGYSAAETALNSAKTLRDQVKEVRDKAKTAVDNLVPKIKEAEEALNGKAAEGDTPATVGAKKEYEDAKAARDNVLGYIFSAVSKAEGAEGIKEVIEKQFNEFVYDTAELDYFNEISANLAKEIAKLLKEHIEVKSDKLPKKAVNEVYEKLYEEHKRKFFLSASLDSETAEYTTFGGDFEKYLMNKTSTDSYRDAKKALKDEARGYVATVVRIYRAAQLFELVYTNAEFKEDHDKSEYNYKYREDYEAYVASMAQMYAGYGLSAYYYDAEDMATKQDIMTAEQLAKLFDGLLACERDEDGKPVFENGKFKYNSGFIGYTIKGQTVVPQ